jgi:hypothetical protein
MNYPPPEQVAINQHFNIAIWYYACLFLAIAGVLTLFYKFFKTEKKLSDFSKFNLLFLWLILGIGLFGFYKKPIYDYYFGFMFPLPFLLSGYVISTFSRRKKVYLAIAIAIFVGISALNLSGIPFKYEPNRQLKQVETISKFALNKTDNKPFNFALISGNNSDHGYRYFFTLWGRPPVAIESLKVDPKRTTVTQQLIVVCEILPCHPLGHPLWEVAGFGRAEIVGEWNVSVVKVYKLIRYKGE